VLLNTEVVFSGPAHTSVWFLGGHRRTGEQALNTILEPQLWVSNNLYDERMAI
jgi:hypothetical protein